MTDSLQWVLHYLFVPALEEASPSLADQYNKPKAVEMVSLIWDPYIELKAELSKDEERLHNSHHASAVWNSESLTGNNIVRGENQQRESCQGDYFCQKKNLLR